MYLILFTFDKKILQYWKIFVPRHHLLNKNLDIENKITHLFEGLLSQNNAKMVFSESVPN